MPPVTIGTKGSATRTLLLDATEKLMVEEGYAAVTSRSLSARAGLKSALVHYHFHTMDDLFLAVYGRVVERTVEQLKKAMKESNPIRAFWDFTSDPAGAALAIELRALANHRKALRTEMARSLELFRQVMVKDLSRLLKAHGIESQVRPQVVAILAGSVSRFIVSEKMLGVSKGHADTLAFVESYLCRFDGAVRSSKALSSTESQLRGRPMSRSRKSKAAK